MCKLAKYYLSRYISRSRLASACNRDMQNSTMSKGQWSGGVTVCFREIKLTRRIVKLSAISGLCLARPCALNTNERFLTPAQSTQTRSSTFAVVTLADPFSMLHRSPSPWEHQVTLIGAFLLNLILAPSAMQTQRRASLQQDMQPDHSQVPHWAQCGRRRSQHMRLRDHFPRYLSLRQKF